MCLPWEKEKMKGLLMVFGSHFQLPFDFHKYKNNFKLIIPFSLFLDKKNFKSKSRKACKFFSFFRKISIKLFSFKSCHVCSFINERHFDFFISN